MNLSKKQIKSFQQKVLMFYKNNKRDLPWRTTNDPYKILLSEMMLQQTQVSRVIDYYHQWITMWPTIKHLANASRKDVLHAWMGLGYNSRAIRLHDTAKHIVRKYNGDVIKALKKYNELPGIGQYTSDAIQIFSVNADIATVDTNIRRIFIHEFGLDETIADKELWALAQACLPTGNSREWHNALMDYGALHLTSQKTGIKPKTQQSKFEGSDRQIRAKIMRIVLEKAVTFTDLQKRLLIDKSRLQSILDKMKKENLIVEQKNKYVLSE
jgi:A/G-specific adenine glycosylase